ncbi:translocon-associated protein subunit alpha-like isoform X2 [Ostrea edulis]|uniref:translocon-associated protein subunit alpha-like isoform X2 n=1 Tax=Ostrea edulis TaxID=37623 RepID=UPI0020954D88|nr:translocon-associated protein subunit alpha-like isoform X2 [Ostrea edulis]
MWSLFGKMMLVLLLVLPCTVMVFENDKMSVYAQDGDAVEGEDDEDTVVENEDGTDDAEQAVTETEKGEDEEESTDDEQLKPSPDADAVMLFTKPVGTTDLPAGETIRFLVGFTNKGEKTFTVQSLECSFRYPQDYNFFIQNYTTAQYNQEVASRKQATFEYGFTPNEGYAGRPFGLSILLNYKDEDGNAFMSAVFNETVNIVEPDEGLDGETFFLYVFLAAIAVLLMVGAQQLLANFSKKHRSKKSYQQPVEMGTQNTDVDYDWIPKETLERDLNRSPGRSPKQSPRQRKSKRTAGSGEE